MLVAGDLLGTLRSAPNGRDWQAYTPSFVALPHRGRGRFARTRQDAVVDLVLGLNLR